VLAYLATNAASSHCVVATFVHRVFVSPNSRNFFYLTRACLVCGEDCSVQICPLCAPEHVKDTVVDIIMYRKLGEIDLEQETLDEILITLPGCRHVFTVETLDGICDMNQFYARDDANNHWLDFVDPPTGFRKPPTCPTCRAAITSPRYGRIFKRADLDILENNVASQMSHSLGNVHQLMGLLSHVDIGSRVATDAGRTKVKHTYLDPKDSKSRKKAQATLLNGTKSRQVPTPLDTLNPGNQKFHSVAPSAAQAWQVAIGQLLTIYAQAGQIAETRSAHVNAWEAAFSCLYEQEATASLDDPAHAPRRPAEHAMRVARMKVGQPPPRADKRFLVEAFWVTLDLRFTLASLAQAWMEAAGNNKLYAIVQLQIWATYVGFILRTCCQDAQIAFDIATESGSHRQAVKTVLYCMRAELEQYRFNVHMIRQNECLTENREKLVAGASQKAAEAEKMLKSTVRNYLRVRASLEDKQWLEDNFTKVSRTFVEEWSAIERSLRCDTFYEPVSLEEQMAVVRALSTSWDFGEFFFMLVRICIIIV
jgi:hypothetical protein